MGEERFVDTKGVTKNCKSKKDRNTLAKIKKDKADKQRSTIQYNEN